MAGEAHEAVEKNTVPVRMPSVRKISIVLT